MPLARWSPRSSIWKRWALSNGRAPPTECACTSSLPLQTLHLATPVTGSCVSQTAARCGYSWLRGGGAATTNPTTTIVMPVCSVEQEGKYGGKRAHPDRDLRLRLYLPGRDSQRQHYPGGRHGRHGQDPDGPGVRSEERRVG